MAGWADRRDAYQAITRTVDPAVRLVVKEGWFWTALAWILCIITFGGVRPLSFMRDYATTIGPIQAYPPAWPDLSTRLLVHEARHTRQARWFGLWIHPWVGLPIYAVLYLLLFLPLGLAWFRYRFELDADVTSWRWCLANGVSAETVRVRAQTFGQTVASGSYGWPWPKSLVKRGFAKAVEKEIGRAPK